MNSRMSNTRRILLSFNKCNDETVTWILRRISTKNRKWFYAHKEINGYSWEGPILVHKLIVDSFIVKTEPTYETPRMPC